MKWVFNKDYKDYEQVECFYSLFDKLHSDMEKKGTFPYNSLFEGKFDIDDKAEEKTAIYMLQQSKTEKTRLSKIEELQKEGFQAIEKGEGIKKFKKIVQVGTDYSRATIKEFEDSRIVFKDGYIYGILPKGHSSRGYHIWPDRLRFAK